ncbi:MAG: hypothetical protein B7X95_07910 [Methylophilaceae bacterium 17-44-8]|nr:MAG: hypothetical protein B7Y32_05470 [Methylophilales bacterium 16-45-7]OZA05073.1 MAG: hypothetical protein B7X95_07910 [Methylophilaceae bacterium 17-44-8]
MFSVIDAFRKKLIFKQPLKQVSLESAKSAYYHDLTTRASVITFGNRVRLVEHFVRCKSFISSLRDVILGVDHEKKFLH